MANRAQLRAGLRRLVHESEADQWTDVELNEVLNEAMQSIQELILMVDPEAFTVWQKRNIEANERYYLRPVDIIWDVELGFSATPGSTDYRPLRRVSFQELRSAGADRAYTEPSDVATYAKTGNYYYLGWNPESNISEGLQDIYTPWLAMDEDEDVPPISLGFHRMIKIDAAIKILKETPDDTTELEKEREEFIAKINRYYRSSATTPDMISPDLGKDRPFV